MLGAALTAALLYWLLRQMERWLQQHIFKVGWLLTKDFRTTTVLYYVFFLPGVLLHELSLWLVAGILNVRAERSAQFPQPQEAPELRLNFVRVSPRAPKWKLTLIELAPSVAGIIVVALIADGVLNIAPALTVMRSGVLEDVGAGVRMMTSTPDFWLWSYVLLTVANTMAPRLTSSASLVRPAIIVTVAAVVLAVALGLAQDAISAVVTALEQFLNVLAAVFGITVLVNAAAISVLAVIENSIERITGDSATIDRHGKLVAKKRAEILAERLAERQRLAKAREAEKPKSPGATEGIPSIYRMQFPLPDTSEHAKRVIMPAPTAALEPPRHQSPDVIEAMTEVVVEKPRPLMVSGPDSESEIDSKDAPRPVVRPAAPRPSPDFAGPAKPATPIIPTRTAPGLPPSNVQSNELDKMSSAFGTVDDEEDDYGDEDDVDEIEPV